MDRAAGIGHHRTVLRFRVMAIATVNSTKSPLSEEQQLLRAAVRQLAEDKIAPRAAEVDETAEFPYDVLDVLVRAGFHAVHIAGGVRRSGGGRRLGVPRRRGGGPRLRVVLADPGGEQARQPADHPRPAATT